MNVRHCSDTRGVREREGELGNVEARVGTGEEGGDSREVLEHVEDGCEGVGSCMWEAATLKLYADGYVELECSCRMELDAKGGVLRGFV